MKIQRASDGKIICGEDVFPDQNLGQDWSALLKEAGYSLAGNFGEEGVTFALEYWSRKHEFIVILGGASNCYMVLCQSVLDLLDVLAKASSIVTAEAISQVMYHQDEVPDWLSRLLAR